MRIRRAISQEHIIGEGFRQRETGEQGGKPLTEDGRNVVPLLMLAGQLVSQDIEPPRQTERKACS
jgi:hypothetical protein